MKTLRIVCTLPVLFLAGAGCAQVPFRATVQNIVPIGTSSTPSVENTFPGYKSMLQREAIPEWRQVTFNGSSLSIPYSPDWKFSNTGLSLYDTYPENEITAICFGKPIDSGTLVTREYCLVQKPKMTLDLSPQDKDDLRCVDGFEARFTRIGNINGIEHHTGGAKGCSTGFAFTSGNHTYFLYRGADMGAVAPNIDEEMKKIIQSIKP